MKSITSYFILFTMMISMLVLPDSAFAEGGSWSVSGAQMYETEDGVGITYSEGTATLAYHADKAYKNTVILEYDLKSNGARQTQVNAYSEAETRLFYIGTSKNIWAINGYKSTGAWNETSIDYEMGEYSENHFMYIIDISKKIYSVYIDGNCIVDEFKFLYSGSDFASFNLKFTNPFTGSVPSAEVSNVKVYNKTKEQIENDKLGEAVQPKTDYFADMKSALLNNKIFMIGSNVVFENYKTESFEQVVYEDNGAVYIPKQMIDKTCTTNDYVTAESVGAVRNGKFLSIGNNPEGFLKLEADLRLERVFGIYVSPDGSDDADGTIDKPLKTISAAKELIKSIRADEGIPNGGIQVMFRGGEYNIDESITFNKTDSGSPKSPITYRSYPGEEAKLTGSAVLPSENFKKVTDADVLARFQQGVAENVWQLDLKEIGLEKWGAIIAMGNPNSENIGSTTISSNGELLTVASWPNDTYSRVTEVNNGAHIDNDRVLSWKQPQYAFLYGWSLGWYQGSTRFNVNPQNGALNLNTTIAHGGLSKGKRIQVINVLEELDKEGEWYVDNDTSILYVWLPETPENSHVTMSMLKENFLNLYGTEYVTFERLYFGEARGNGVYGDKLDNVNFYGCKFNQLGRKAIMIENSYNCKLVSCDIEEIGKGGISIGGGDRQTLTYGNNLVENCHIREFSMQNKCYANGISLNGVGNKAVNNQLNDVPHQAASFSGNYNELAYNEMYNLLYESDDAGAIYTGKSFVNQGNKVNYNFIHDIEKGSGASNDKVAIYMDDQMCGSEITGNLIVDCSVAMLLHGGREHTVKDNLAINCSKGITAIDWYYKTQLNSPDMVMWVDLEASPYKTELWKERFPRLINVREDQPAEPKYNTIINNVDLNALAVGTNASNNYKNYGTYENNINSNDLSYVYNAENYDFKVNVNSELFKSNQNLTPVPYEKMGMYYDKYRTKMPELGEFEQGYPENGATDVEANSVTFSWSLADNASEYEFILAKDENFTEIVHQETKRGLPSITVKGLEYNSTDYYWKVIAKMNTKLTRDEKPSENGPFKFTTAQDEALNTLNFERIIQRADGIYKNAVEGENVGNYEKGSKAEFYTAISAAKKLLSSKDLKQYQVVEAEGNLKTAINLFSAKGIRGDFYLDEENLQSNLWTKGTVKQADGSYYINKGQNASKFKVSQFETVHMRIKIGIVPPDWQGITIRNGLNNKQFYSGNTNYGIVVKEDILEFQQYAAFNVDGRNGVVETIDNTYIKSGEWYDLTIKADNTAEGVRVTVSVDGQVVYDILDDRDFSVLQDGYINFKATDIYVMPIENKSETE